MITLRNALAGLSCGSLKPELAALSTTVSSSLTLTGLTVAELEVPTGASLTERTLKVKVRGVSSRILPPLARLPLSCTWKVKVGLGLPLESEAGLNVTLPARNSLIGILWLFVIAEPLKSSEPPWRLRLENFTATKLSAGESPGSVKPKSLLAPAPLPVR